MTDTVLQGADDLMRQLEEYVNRLGGGEVEVGFLDGTYPDGESVPLVAFKNEFGVPSNRQPPRPFFRRMIAEKSPGWIFSIAQYAQATNMDGPQALALMGEQVAAELKESIYDLVDPPLAAYTIAKKGNSKPLIDTAVMVDSIQYKVNP